MTPKKLKELEQKLQLAVYALNSATYKSFYEGANKKETVDLCIEWAKKILKEIE